MHLRAGGWQHRWQSNILRWRADAEQAVARGSIDKSSLGRPAGNDNKHLAISLGVCICDCLVDEITRRAK